MTNKKIHTFREFIELDESATLGWKALRGLWRFIKGAGDDVGGAVIKPRPGVVRGVSQSVDDWISDLQAKIRALLPGQVGQGGITDILFGYWQTFRNFLRDPSPENWQQVMNLLRHENFTPYVSDGRLGFHMNRHIQDMGDASENQIVDSFFDLMLEVLNNMGIDWNDFL